MIALVKAALIAACVIALAVAPRVLSVFYVNVLSQILIFGIFAMGFDLVFGYGGKASLGHAAFYGLGAYAIAIGAKQHHLAPGTAILLAIASGALLALLFGLLALRTEGIYFLLMTLALGQAVWGLAVKQVAITKGDNGISGIARPRLLGLSLRPPDHFYYAALLCLVVVGLLLFLIVRSPFGRALAGARESESRMAALGYDVRIYRLGAFAISGACAGLAGALLAYFNGSAGPSTMNWTVSADVLVASIFGGPDTVIGPLIGAGLIQGTELLVSSHTEHWKTVLGLIYVATILILPRGILRPTASPLAGLLRGLHRSGGSKATTRPAAAALPPRLDER